jgi:hypothetical protein
VWKEGGDVCIHSKLVTTVVSVFAVKNSGECHGLAGDTLLTVSASYIMYTSNNTPTNDIKLPIELIIFHPVNASG